MSEVEGTEKQETMDEMEGWNERCFEFLGPEHAQGLEACVEKGKFEQYGKQGAKVLSLG